MSDAQTQQPGPQPYAASGPSGPRAGFWRRFAAYFLDGILVAIVEGILLAALGKGAGYALATIANWAYFTYFEGGPRGQTLGKMLLNVRVIDFDTGAPIGYGRAFIRQLMRLVDGAVILLGYLWMLWDREKQTWHDKVARSVVVPIDAYPVT